MNLEEIQALRQRLFRIFDCVKEPFPAGVQIEELKQDAEAGEEALALEMFCSQLYEYDVVVPREAREAIQELGQSWGIEARHWENLDRIESE